MPRLDGGGSRSLVAPRVDAFGNVRLTPSNDQLICSDGHVSADESGGKLLTNYSLYLDPCVNTPVSEHTSAIHSSDLNSVQRNETIQHHIRATVLFILGDHSLR